MTLARLTTDPCLSQAVPAFGRLSWRAAAVLLGAALCATGAVAATGGQGSADPVAPLLADDGSAYPSSYGAVRAGQGAGVAAPGWASPAQRDQLERLHPQRVVRLDAGRVDGDSLRARDRGAWLFIDGPTEQAVRVARRLVDAGMDRVWVMRPDAGERAAAATQVLAGSRP